MTLFGSSFRTLLAAGLTLDFWKPPLYKLEKAVASQQIPSVLKVPTSDRKKLSDFEPVTRDKFDHSLWTKVLQRSIVETDGTIGDVTGIHLLDYDAIAQDADFESYLTQLAQADVESLPEREQLAFWMNAYNALCVSLLVQKMEYAQNAKTGTYSITNLSSLGTTVWDQPAGTVAGKMYSLNDIEHEELRLKWAEPAVHGCIVCAAASCPNLRREAFVGSRVAEQMTEQMRLWMNNDSFGIQLDKTNNRLYLSRIFLWFGDDFGGWSGLREWLPQFLEDGTEVKSRIEKGNVKVRYFEYNWQMNRKD